MKPMDAIRTFIALEIPDVILDHITEIQTRFVTGLPDHLVRWTKPGSIHLTLKFLGQTPNDQTELIISTVGAAVATHPTFTLEVSGAGCFPNLHQPRIVWIGVHEDQAAHQLRALQHTVEAATEPLGYPIERREFSPHLTLGRVAQDARPTDLKKIGEVIGAADVGVLGRFEVKQVVLIKSDLQPHGAVYTVLAHLPLKS
jgi:2'-5' RNA ligase